MKKYICPHCKEKQTSVIEWQTVSMATEFNLKTKEFESGINKEGGDHEAWVCPECGEELPEELCEKIEKTLFG